MEEEDRLKKTFKKNSSGSLYLTKGQAREKVKENLGGRKQLVGNFSSPIENQLDKHTIISEFNSISNCCAARSKEGGCLSALFSTNNDQLVFYVQRCRHQISKEEIMRGRQLCSLVKDCIISADVCEKGVVVNEYEYTVPPLGFLPGRKSRIKVCRTAFRFVYGISDWAFRQAVLSNNECCGSGHDATATSVKAYTDSTIHPLTYAEVVQVIENNCGPGTAGIIFLGFFVFFLSFNYCYYPI